MLKTFIRAITIFSILFCIANANYPKMKRKENEMYANIVSCKDSRLNNFKAVKNFLKSSEGALAYDNVDIKYVNREKQVKMTVHRGSADGEVVHQVTLSDYKTEQELHDLFEKIGLEKLLLTAEDVQKALDQMKKDAEEAYRKKAESMAGQKRELEGAGELKAQLEKSKLVMERKKKLEEEAKLKAEMEMKDSMEKEAQMRQEMEQQAKVHAEEEMNNQVKAHAEAMQASSIMGEL